MPLSRMVIEGKRFVQWKQDVREGRYGNIEFLGKVALRHHFKGSISGATIPYLSEVKQ